MPRYRSDVHVDQALTNISLAYSQSAGFVGNLLFPTVPVAKDSFKYFTYGRGVFGDGNTRLEWVDGSNPPEVSSTRSTQSGLCLQYGAADYVTDEELRNQDAPLNAYADVTEELTEQILLEHEKEAATKATTAGNYPTANKTTLETTDQWSDVANSNPIDDISAGIDAIRTQVGGRVSGQIVVIAGPVAHRSLMNHPDIVDFAKRSVGALPNEAQMANLFSALGVRTYAVGGGVTNTAHEGATESMSDIWGDNVVLAYVPTAAGIRRPAFGYSFSSVQARVEREPRRNHAVKLIASATWDLQFICRDSSADSIAGYLISDTTA